MSSTDTLRYVDEVDIRPDLLPDTYVSRPTSFIHDRPTSCLHHEQVSACALAVRWSERPGALKGRGVAAEKNSPDQVRDPTLVRESLRELTSRPRERADTRVHPRPASRPYRKELTSEVP